MEPVSRREDKLNWEHHAEIHAMHERAHDREHEMTSDALNKADQALEKRLEGMNEFRSQLEKQAADFLSRSTFEQYIKEQNTRTDLAASTIAEKYDTIIKAIVNRHESDTDALMERHQTDMDAMRVAHANDLENIRIGHNKDLDGVKNEIQNEREIRKTLEGSLNTWKWLLGFLGASGLAGVIIMFATNTR